MSQTNRAQSTVIGAILLIVVTIILVSFVSVYVFDVGGQQLQSDVPQASFTFQNTSTGLVATLDGGQNINAAHLEIVVTDNGLAPTANATGETLTTGTITRADASSTAIFGTGTIKVGDSATVAKHVGDGDQVRIVFIDPDSDQGTTLARYEG